MVQDKHSMEEYRFEGIGPYSSGIGSSLQGPFRLVTAPKTSPRVAPAPEREPMVASVPAAPTDIEAWERRVYVSARWCDVSLSLLILASGAAALFRLICLGQP